MRGKNKGKTKTKKWGKNTESKQNTEIERLNNKIKQNEIKPKTIIQVLKPSKVISKINFFLKLHFCYWFFFFSEKYFLGLKLI